MTISKRDLKLVSHSVDLAVDAFESKLEATDGVSKCGIDIAVEYMRSYRSTVANTSWSPAMWDFFSYYFVVKCFAHGLLIGNKSTHGIVGDDPCVYFDSLSIGNTWNAILGNAGAFGADFSAYRTELLQREHIPGSESSASCVKG